MAKGVTRLAGMREAREALQQLSKAVQRGVGKRALRVPARIVAEDTDRRAKVSSRASNPTPGSLKASPQVVDAKSEKGSPRIAVLVEDPAAVPKEYGLGQKDYPAEPFFRPAVEAVREVAGRAMTAALRQEVDAAAHRAAKRKA